MYSGLAPQGPAVFPRREGPARAGRCRSDAGVPVVREGRTGPWMVVLLEAGLREDSPQPREGGGQGSGRADRQVELRFEVCRWGFGGKKWKIHGLRLG